jgi:hypothetical protein
MAPICRSTHACRDASPTEWRRPTFGVPDSRRHRTRCPVIIGATLGQGVSEIIGGLRCGRDEAQGKAPSRFDNEPAASLQLAGELLRREPAQ